MVEVTVVSLTLSINPYHLRNQPALSNLFREAFGDPRIQKMCHSWNAESIKPRLPDSRHKSYAGAVHETFMSQQNTYNSICTWGIFENQQKKVEKFRQNFFDSKCLVRERYLSHALSYILIWRCRAVQSNSVQSNRCRAVQSNSDRILEIVDDMKTIPDVQLWSLNRDHVRDLTVLTI